jgi:hypothetical protein
MKYLAQGGHSLRGIDEATYVSRCRVIWDAIPVDELYKSRFIQDDVIEGGSGEPYGVAVAQIRANTDDSGTHWSVPFDYHALRKPLGPTRRELIFVYPPNAEQQEPEEPTKQHLMVALFDVLGFESKLRAIGLDQMHARYNQLIHRALVPSAAEGKLSLAAGMLAGEFRQGYLRLPIRFAYFSDTILLWAPFHPAFIGTFLDRCSSLMCNALRSEFPLRGAVVVGNAILHRRTNTFLGAPLVEAARLEAGQQAIGVALGRSMRSIAMPPDRIIRFEAPIKPAAKHLLSGLMLDWPRHWREFIKPSLSGTIRGLRTRPFEKYDGALAFVEYSSTHHDWFLAELPSGVRPVKVTDERGRPGRGV